MKILVACEWSGVVRDAFVRRGHDAVSCDLEPSASQGGPHYQGDVTDILGLGWDMMIAFPPCTFLCRSGIYWSFRSTKRMAQTEKAVWFVRTLMDAPIPRIAVENPVGVLSSRIRKPDQIIQPWMFGEDAAKKTCLWLRNLPPLVPTNVTHKARYANQTPSGQNNIGPRPDRAKLRGKTYPGIAEAMADQWGNLSGETEHSHLRGAGRSHPPVPGGGVVPDVHHEPALLRPTGLRHQGGGWQ